MTIVATQLPVFGQYPAGVSVNTGIASPLASGSQTSTTGPVDIVDIRNRMTKVFTATAGDNFSVGQLFKGAAHPAAASQATRWPSHLIGPKTTILILLRKPSFERHNRPDYNQRFRWCTMLLLFEEELQLSSAACLQFVPRVGRFTNYKVTGPNWRAS